MAKPDCLEELSNLKKLRNALAHFRECDVPIVENENGVIQKGQDLPSELKKLQNRKFRGKQIFAPPEGSAWTLRLATDSMASWSLEICLDAIEHVLNELPTGRYRDFVWKACASRDGKFASVFEAVKNELVVWWHGLEDDGKST